ncbi:MAG: hypothetical protein JSW00_13225 [Thermoplasmata archaeon]|nr:MAG: hypothetical protein JSW00_13225 [Thermoplasmata archaeon]
MTFKDIPPKASSMILGIKSSNFGSTVLRTDSTSSLAYSVHESRMPQVPNFYTTDEIIK